ncbi:MAG: hypothetical protein M1327_04510 [Candidatus Thermoplasmatota archaeon]|nr:hypothetical protein [Candidatus Thermoplasmatota archaeon]
MLDHKRRERLGSAKRYITGHENQVFTSLLSKLQVSGNPQIVAGDFSLKYAYCELKEEDKPELEVIEDIPTKDSSVYSLSFDITTKGEMVAEAVFYRDEIALTPNIRTRDLENLVQSILGISP